jgi:tRNA threonylcarbamoyladenosine biosynthesis protein TsaE
MRSHESFSTRSADETRALGEQLGQLLLPGDLVTLSGELGAGKTTFVQGLARALGIHSSVVSPTFVLIIEHDGPVPLLHLDAYRLESMCYDAIRDAGVVDLLERQDAIKIVEWPERIADWLPVPRAAVTFAPGTDENQRCIEIVTT